MASFFGIQSWFHREVRTLSGGQKQLLNLACRHGDAAGAAPSRRADEPARPHRRGGVSRRARATQPRARHDRAADGAPAGGGAAPRDARRSCSTAARCSAPDRPRRSARRSANAATGSFSPCPTAMRVWAAVGERAALPRNGARGQGVAARLRRSASALAAAAGAATPREARPCSRRRSYGSATRKTVPTSCAGWTSPSGGASFFALLGGNGAGKTTALRLLAGLRTPDRGERAPHRRMSALLPQDPQTLFVKKTVREDLREVFARRRPFPSGAGARRGARCRALLPHRAAGPPPLRSLRRRAAARRAREAAARGSRTFCCSTSRPRGSTQQFKRSLAAILAALRAQRRHGRHASATTWSSARATPTAAHCFSTARSPRRAPRGSFSPATAFYDHRRIAHRA